MTKKKTQTIHLEDLANAGALPPEPTASPEAPADETPKEEEGQMATTKKSKKSKTAKATKATKAPKEKGPGTIALVLRVPPAAFDWFKAESKKRGQPVTRVAREILADGSRELAKILEA